MIDINRAIESLANGQMLAHKDKLDSGDVEVTLTFHPEAKNPEDRCAIRVSFGDSTSLFVKGIHPENAIREALAKVENEMTEFQAKFSRVKEDIKAARGQGKT